MSLTNIFHFSSIVALLLLGFSTSSIAQVTDALFEDQRSVFTSRLENEAHQVTLSSLKKINSVWVAEQEQMFPGRLDRRTIEFSQPYTLDTAWEELQQFFSDLQGQLIFECRGLDCGSSNAWANVRFGIKQLYGLDLSQRYQVWQLSAAGRTQFVSAYLVQRGNRRLYLHLDVLTPDDLDAKLKPSAAVIAKSFYRDGKVELRGLSFSEGNIVIDEEYLSAFAEAFNEQPFRRLVVVGQDFFPGAAEERAQRSLQYAQAVFDALTRLGVRARRMEVQVDENQSTPTDTSLNARVIVLLHGAR